MGSDSLSRGESPGLFQVSNQWSIGGKHKSSIKWHEGLKVID